jgi:hypothetical protein
MTSRARTTALSLLLLAAVTCLTIAGCGGGASTAGTATSASTTSTTSVGTNSTPKSPGTSPAESQFIAKADEICRGVNIELAAIKPKSKGLQEVARLTPRNVALEEGALAKLAKLNPPSSLAHDWQQMLGYRRVLADELSKLVGSARQEDAAALKALTASKKRTHASLGELATRDGFKDCATVGLGKTSAEGKGKPA